MASQRIYSIQGLRAIAFLAIFISHSGIGNYGCLGAWGVSVFFVLSGFLMTLSHLNKEDNPKVSFRFALNKIMHLYPLHIITMLLAAVYAAYCGQHLMKVSFDMLIHSLLIQMWIPNTQFYTTLNGPAWYLCTLFFCYFCFPLIFRFVNGICSDPYIVKKKIDKDIKLNQNLTDRYIYKYWIADNTLCTYLYSMLHLCVSR